MDDGSVRAAHLGDLGCGLTAEQKEQLKGLDALMIPVGGTYTLTGEEAAKVAKAIGAKVTIPMHYKEACVQYPITDEQPFFAAMGVQNVPKMAVLEVRAQAVEKLPSVCQMDWKA